MTGEGEATLNPTTLSHGFRVKHGMDRVFSFLMVTLESGMGDYF
jgi:hypothetical protein